MKLPKHYEEWLDESCPYRTLQEFGRYMDGARAMHHKLMADLAPAIEALEFGDKVYGSIKFAEALTQLKEKGLME